MPDAAHVLAENGGVTRTKEPCCTRRVQRRSVEVTTDMRDGSTLRGDATRARFSTEEDASGRCALRRPPVFRSWLHLPITCFPANIAHPQNKETRSRDPVDLAERASNSLEKEDRVEELSVLPPRATGAKINLISFGSLAVVAQESLRPMALRRRLSTGLPLSGLSLFSKERRPGAPASAFLSRIYWGVPRSEGLLR